MKANTNTKKPIQLWIDTDTSGLVWSGLDCDDDLAVLVALALHKQQIISLDGLSVCGGNAPLSHTWEDIRAMWKHADGFHITNIQPIKGYGWRSMQVAVGWLRWYSWIRQDVVDSTDASSAIVEYSRTSPEPFHILMLGPPTNLAKAIDSGQLDESAMNVYLMGGELTQQMLDLNFRTDRASARTVIESNIPTTIIPIQTCAQAIVTESYLQKIDCPSMAACALLPKMKQQITLMPKFVNPAVKKRCLPDAEDNIRWKLSPNLDSGFIPWDVVALLAITHRDEFLEWKYHNVTIPSCSDQIGEPCDSTMIVVDDIGEEFDGKDWRGVVRIPHIVRDEEALLDIMFSLLNEVPAISLGHPVMFWGFYSEILLTLCISIIVLKLILRCAKIK